MIFQSGLWLVFLYAAQYVTRRVGGFASTSLLVASNLRFWNNIAVVPVGSFFHTVLLDSLYDAFHHSAFNFTSSVAACLHRVGVSMPRDTDRVHMLDISAAIDALKADLQGLGASTVSCPSSILWCSTYDKWFQPFSKCRRYCQLPISGKNMKRFLQFRLGCRKLPITTGRPTGGARACRLCTFGDAGAVGDEKHLVFECTQFAPL